jgi:hypothetical protein
VPDPLTVAALVVGLVALIVAIVGTIIGLRTLLPVLRQQRLDTTDPWPFEIAPIGSTFDTVTPNLPVLKIKFRNMSSQTAYFMLACGSGDPGFGFHRPHRVSIWPTGETWKLYLEIPPRVWREVRISPFALGQPQPETWMLAVWEFYHGKASPKSFCWPEELRKPLKEPAQYLPEPYPNP